MKRLIIISLAAFFTNSVYTFADYGGGTGEPNDPYQIADVNDLMTLANDTNDYNKCFIMTADINLTDYTFNTAVIAPDTDIYHAWYTGTAFTGNLDGNGHNIENLTIIQNTYYIDHIGFIGELRGTVENLGITNYSITVEEDSSSIGAIISSNYGVVRNCKSSGSINGGINYIGGIVGANKGLIVDCNSTCDIFSEYDCEFLGGIVGLNNGRVERCRSSGYVGGNNSPLCLGGLVGNNVGYIIYCYSTATVVGGIDSIDLGGLAGRNNKLLYYSYAVGRVIAYDGSESIGGLVGRNYYGNILGCYAGSRFTTYGTVTNKGGLVGENYYAEIKDSFWDTQISGTAQGCASDTGGNISNLFGRTTSQMQEMATFTDTPARWDFAGEPNNGGSDDWAMPQSPGYPILWWQLNPWPPLPAFSGGAGTSEGPFIIQDVNNLKGIGHNSRMMDKHFILTGDINLQDQFFAPLSNAFYPFSGVFDGSGHTILHLTFNATAGENIGLFSYLANNSLLKNLGVEDANITVDSAERIGILAGENEGGFIENCFVSGRVSIGQYGRDIGGLVGNNSGNLEKCFAMVSLASGGDPYGIGGLAGWSFGGEIDNCYTQGSIETGTNSRNIGGLIGARLGTETDVNVNNCYAACSVAVGQSSYAVGGLIGALLEYGPNPPMPNACFWDVNLGAPDNNIGIPLTTLQMKQQASFVNWDFNDIWSICEGTNYPKLIWQIPAGDFICPDGVDIFDLAELCEQWLFEEIPADLAPPGGDGIVNFADFSVFAEQWGITNDIYDLLDFSQQWLKTGLQFCSADIAPAPNGDRKVDMVDFTLIAENWLQ